MRHLIITGLCFLFFFSANAQGIKQSQESPSAYFNNFQKYLYTTPNADSAFYFAQKLASNIRYVYLLRQLIHNSFAQEFIQRNVKDINEVDSLNHSLIFSKPILQKMISDTPNLLSETAKPLYLWTKIEDNRNNLSVLTNLTNEFIKTELASDNFYENSIGRYGLLIYQVISKHAKLKPLATNLFATIYSNLKNNQVIATESSSRADLDKRAWYRYLYAYSNYITAKQTDVLNKKETFLKMAFDFSPDLTDNNHRAAYIYDAGFLFPDEEKESFKSDYLTFLTHTADNREKVLSTLLSIALVEPEYKNKLEAFYNKNNSTSKKFNIYWMEAINSNARIAPSISLYTLDRKLFLSKHLSGKWILVDFWGTWCIPCRKEHPDMQKFYDSIVVAEPKKISLLTIACKDTKEKVLDYLQEKHFTFPVAMSDNEIENIYSVQGYPTKILITPEGKYVIVPFNIDWINFVKQYCNL